MNDERNAAVLFENAVIRLESNSSQLRALVGDTVLVDSTGSICLHEQGHGPVSYVPKADVRFDLLEHTDRTTHCPRKGDAEYWSIVIGDRRIDNAVWGYPSPLPDAPDLTDFVAFYWDRIDQWTVDGVDVTERGNACG